MSSLSAGVIGIRQATSASDSPVYDVPFGTVQLASSSKDGSFDLAAGFAAASAELENQEEEDASEADDDDGDSEDGKGKGKKGKRARSEAKGERDQKTGRRKIKIEFIDDDARRHITFSKRKAGIMKKAYELATLTGTQVLLLVVSQTGLVYTFTTPKLQALVTQAEGRNLIQACLNAPDPPNGAGESGVEDHSVEEASDNDNRSSPSESQMSSNKRPAQNRKRPRTNSASKSSSASTSAAINDDDATASGSQMATAKRGRGRPRKNTAGANAACAEASSSAPSTSKGANRDASHPMPPPLAMHQSYSDDAVHHHNQHQQSHHQQPQYTHVPTADFANYNTNGFYGADAAGFTAQQSMGNVDANQWSQTLSPPNAQQFNYNAAQHFGHFNPQQLAGIQQSQEMQAPRPAW
uniref:MADS-box homolog Umc1 n=1 Tax=Melanopsichium pennsylvanicum 4 TaxID=1398559 RepID=A0A077R032_9BASI|nr:MADS-box homolog Umc1 [Melanopsichium pennsylvanicum 4]